MSIIPINPTINPNTSDDACCYGHPQAGPGSDAEWLGRGPGWELRGKSSKYCRCIVQPWLADGFYGV